MKISIKLRNHIFFVLGSLLTALTISVFYLPNKIVTGGVSGISTILFHTAGIQPGVTYFVVNAVLLLIGFKYLGRDFVIKTIIGSSIVTVFVQIFSYLPVLTDNIILNVAFGSILYGFAIGLTLIAGGSTGGTDILGRLIQYRFPSVRIGSAMIISDFIIIFISLIMFKNIDLAMYGIISLFGMSYSINFLIRKLNVSKLAFVITEKGSELSPYLIKNFTRGLTVVDAVGGYTGNKKIVLMCALKERELPLFQKRVHEIDPEAFIIFSESEQIVGNGFLVYR
ncbi:MAG: YitT family protein [Ruminococcaceae bacterium]|nr:YitT family protein [Oscillospiraceae bacterium]